MAQPFPWFRGRHHALFYRGLLRRPERFMTITITSLTVAQTAPAGTIVGVLTVTDGSEIIPCNFILSKKSSGYFAISSNNLVTSWSGAITPGFYSVRVRRRRRHQVPRSPPLISRPTL